MAVEDFTGVADEQLAAFIDRILRMKDEADAIAADIREIYAEAKANGFDKTQLGNVITYLRKKEKDASKLEEGEAVFDLYLGSYLSTKNRAPHVRAYARASNGPEITEPQAAPQAAQDGGAFSEVKGSARLENAVGVEPSPSTPIQPETANDAGSAITGRAARTAAAGHGWNEVAETTEGGPHESEAAAEPVNLDRRPEAGQDDTANLLGEPTNEVATTSAQTVTGEGAHNAPVTTPKPIRPYCLKPTSCGGMGRKHCYTCEHAREKVSA